MAEATGVFFYVFPGIAAVATFTLATTNGTGAELGVSAFGGLLQIGETQDDVRRVKIAYIIPTGFAFGFGIAFAIITCASTSGG